MEILHDSHLHPLKKTKVSGRHKCGICSNGCGEWVYRCAQCNYDAHPWCANGCEEKKEKVHMHVRSLE